LLCAGSARGTEWVHFTRGDDVSGVAQVGSDVWIGTSGGLVRFDPMRGTSQFVNKANSGLHTNAVSRLTADPSGGFWVMSRYQTLVQRFDGTTWSAVDVNESGFGLFDTYGMSMAFGPNGRVWFGTSVGLAALQGNQWQTFRGNDFGIPSEMGVTSSS